MITFEEAEQIVIDRIGPDCAIVSDSIVEKPYGWYFNFQSKKYVETGDFREMLVGSGGFIVEKENGKISELGSHYTLEENFEIYEMGLAGKQDLVILKVKDLNRAVKLLHKLGMTYVEPESAHGVVWKIPQRFNEKQIKAALSNLPHTFQNQRFYFAIEVFKEIYESDCLIYELKQIYDNAAQ